MYSIRKWLDEAETTLSVLKRRTDVRDPEKLGGYLYWKHYDKPPNPTGKGGFTRFGRRSQTGKRRKDSDNSGDVSGNPVERVVQLALQAGKTREQAQMYADIAAQVGAPEFAKWMRRLGMAEPEAFSLHHELLRHDVEQQRKKSTRAWQANEKRSFIDATRFSLASDAATYTGAPRSRNELPRHVVVGQGAESTADVLAGLAHEFKAVERVIAKAGLRAIRLNPKLSATATVQDKDLVVSSRFVAMTPHEQALTLVHEIGHLAEDLYAKEIGAVASDPVWDMLNPSTPSPSLYGTTNASEAFAETFVLHLLLADRLSDWKKYAPHQYAAMRDFLRTVEQ